MKRYGVGIPASASILIHDNAAPPPPPTVRLTAGQNLSVYGIPSAISGTLSGVSSNGYITSYAVRVDGVPEAGGRTDDTSPPGPGTPFEATFNVTNVSAGLHHVQASITDNNGGSASATQTVWVIVLQPPQPPPAWWTASSMRMPSITRAASTVRAAVCRRPEFHPRIGSPFS